MKTNGKIEKLEEERSKILKELRKEKHVEANLDWEIRIEQQLKRKST